MQILYVCDCTSEEYVSDMRWLQASPPACPWCKPKPGCSLVAHGFYARLHPKGTLGLCRIALRSRGGSAPGRARRLVFGNVCPPEAGEVLRALGSGRHHGSLLAMGATPAETALRQLVTWSLADGFSWDAACAATPTAIHVVVRLDREANGNRRAAEVSRVEAAEGGCMLRPA